MKSSEIVRHKKTGGLYEVLYRGATVETPEPLFDGAGVFVCQRVLDGKIVVRPAGLPVPINRIQLIGARLQTGAPIANGDEVVVYRSLDGDARTWVRPTSEMDDGRFEPADAVGAPPPVPTSREVEGLVRALINAVYDHATWGGSRRHQKFEEARTALLSRMALSPAPSDQGVIQRAREVTSLDTVIREMFDLAIEENGRLADASDAVDDLRDQVIDYVRTALQSPSTGDGGGDGRRPDGHGLSSSGPGPTVPAPAGASIPGAGQDRALSCAPFTATCAGLGWEDHEGEGSHLILRLRLTGLAPWPIAAIWERWPVIVSRAAPGIEAGTATTEGRGAEHESPVREAEAPPPTPAHESEGARIPEGWVLVPREPTQEMWCAFRNADAGHVLFHRGYRAMIDASPHPSQEKSGGRDA